MITNDRSSVILFCVVVLAGAPVSTNAQTSAPAPALASAAAPSSFLLTPSVVSQYMFRGVRLGGPAFQPSLEYDYGNLAVGVWASTPIKDKVPGLSDPEIDPYGSYTFAVNDNLSFVPGFTLYTYPRAELGGGYYRSTFEPSVAINYTVAGVKFTPKLYYDVIMKGATCELTAAVTVPLQDLGGELDFTATAGTYKWTDAARNWSPALKNYGDYYLVGVAAPFQVTKASKLSIGFAYTKGSGNFYKTGSQPKQENPAAVGRCVVTLTYTYTY